MINIKSEDAPKDGGSDKKKPGYNYHNNTKPSTKLVFDGDCIELRGYIFDCSDTKQADLFVKTSVKLSEYVGKTYKYFPGDIQTLVKNLEMPVLVMPTDPVANATETEKRIWEKKCDSYAKREEALEQNIQRLHALVMGQCTDNMRAALLGVPDIEDINEKLDGLRLLKAIKGIVYVFHTQKYLPHAVHESVRRFYCLQQGKTITPAAYQQQFINIVDVIETTGGSIGNHLELLKSVANEEGIDVDKATPTELQRLRAASKERYLAVAFILSADRSRYGRYIEDLENNYLQGVNKYPKTVTAAFNLLTNWKQDPRHMMRIVGQVNDGVSFTNVDEATAPKNVASVAMVVQGASGAKAKPHVLCFRCKQNGHYANDCPNEQESGATMLLAGIEEGEFNELDDFQFLQHGESGANVVLQTNDKPSQVSKTWILLDNQSTVDVFANKTMLKNLRQSNSTMTIHCNAGVATTTTIGDLPGYGTVWYHPKGITNILSLSRVIEKGYHVTFDSKDGNKFIVEKPDGSSTRIFQQSFRGLYYMDMRDSKTGIALVSTVEENKTKYTNRDYERAVLARNLQKIIGRPSTRDFMNIVENNLLPNCPITRRDIVIAENIFGPDVGSLKGKTVRHSPVPVNPSLVDIPSHIMSHYREVTLCGDIMFVNRVAFFVTISRHLKFCTAEMLVNQQAKTILTAVKQVKAIYNQRGFMVTTLLMDGQFDVLRADLADLQITLNTVSNDEHVPEVERHIRTIKERARAVYNTLPFPKLPTRMVIELINYCTFWLNSFPAALGVSDVLSPRAIVTGSGINFNAHCQLEFGSYVQTHEQHDNSMLSRTTGAIALRPTGNIQGGHYFFSLTTGRRLNRNNWTVLPMPAEVVDRVRTFCRRDRANLGGINIADRHGNPLLDDADDDIDDPDYVPNDDDADDDNDNDPLYDDNEIAQDDNADIDNLVPVLPIAGVYHDDNELNENENHNENDNELNENDNNENLNVNENENLNVNENENGNAIDNHANEIDNNNNNINENDNINNINENVIENEDNINLDGNNTVHNNDINAEMNELYGERTNAYNLRPRKPRDFSHLHTVLESTMMTQYNMKKGISKFGTDGVNAVLKELQQLHDRCVLEPTHPESMSMEEKKAALAYLMFLKEKRTGEIKGRGCADGRKQRLYTNKEDASSPTVAIESVFITSVIDAKENRDVATVDVPGAFMQADMDDTVYMKLEGTMAQLLMQIAPDVYSKFSRIINGKTVLYVQLKKALYGTLKAALLFWKRLSSQLQAWGFKLNDYDSCVANKDIDGKQCTIIWHVDDLKISHVDPAVVTDIIKLIEGEFGKEAPLTVTRGKVHDYLGMKINFEIPGKVQFIMEDYVRTVLEESPADMSGEAATPAANHLFEVNSHSPTLLDKDKSDLFHHITAKLLFLCKRARPDIQTAVAFLCTRVKAPDVDDYKKLARVIKYLRGTINMPLTLEAENLQLVKWWVDASFAVHDDMKSHTGGAMSLGKGVIYGTSTRQKINTKSSTEAELVGVNEVLPQVLWTRYFLEEQGYGVVESIVYQDNQSAILLEKNGRASSSKRTRHLNIRYFFVTDRIKAGELEIQYCPTGYMIADFFTKALQGTAFKFFRDLILNIDHDTNRLHDHRSVLEQKEMNEVVQVHLTSVCEPKEKESQWILVAKKMNRQKTMRRKSAQRATNNKQQTMLSLN